MKNLLIIILTVFSLSLNAQQSINYKALIKDNLGNVVSNDLIQVQFTILQGVAQTNVYEETYSPTTDANGLIMLNIGEGTVVSGNFSTIEWGADTHFLNVQINTGSGLVDMGTTEFKAVPYAKHSEIAEIANNVTGLEAIDEGNGIGWRLKGNDPNAYGNIGGFSVDLSFNDESSSIYGATGVASVSLGRSTTASGIVSTAMGAYSTAAGNYSHVSGFFSNANGNFSHAYGGYLQADARSSTVFGRYNVGGGDATSWVDTDPLFEVGNGTSNTNRNNALTIYKNGRHLINSNTTGLQIDTSSTGVYVVNPAIYGLRVIGGNTGIISTSPSSTGLSIENAGNVGVYADASNYGARLFGNQAGLYASGGQAQEGVPDIILGSASGSSLSDDGIISTNPNRSGSDMFLRSYDAVVVELDYDNNEAGNFRVRNGAQTIVFDVNESGNATLAGSLTQNSDRRLKTNIEDLSYGLNEVLKLKPKSYHWKDRAKEKKSLGLIAQDVQGIISEIVNTQDDEAKTLGISYNELIPVLIKAIQEQQVIINAQKEENHLQKAELVELNKGYKSLMSRVEKLESSLSN